MEYGRYRIVKELGKGNMGVVYQAHDPQIDRMVALKVLRPDRVTSEAFAARFLKEARAIGRLSHAQIVTVYDVGEDHGTVFIAMEYLEGEPLNEVIQKGGLSVAQSIDIVRQVAVALFYAHQQGIVHRDIKPSNIILTQDMEVKLTDFGIARIEDTSAGYQTQAGEILGTPMYMSPEQVMGEKADGRSDLYSLGVILYEMIAGRRPFSGNNLAAIFRSITHDTPEPPAGIDPFIGRPFSDLIMKSLDKRQDRRFQTGQQMDKALSTIAEEASARPGETKKTIPAAKASKFPYWVLLVVIIAGAATGYYYFSQRPPNDGGADNGGAVVAPQMAHLKVSSEPEGAKLYVDSIYKGQTPYDIQLPLGKYELRLSLAGHLAWEAQVELEAAGDMPLHIPMRATP